MIPYARQSIEEADIEAVVAVLRSDFITQGPAIERFEQAFAERCGAKHAVAVSSGTAALHIACLAAGLGPGDRHWTTPITFVASANCGRYCGGEVEFVDIEPETANMGVGPLREKLEEAEKWNRLPKTLVPVHFAGQSCAMEEIGTLAREHGITVIEDASHATGATYRDRPVGCCDHSDMAVFSFHPVKIITTGEGGMVVTNRDDLYKKLVRLRTHGITRDPESMNEPSHGPWYYQQLEMGFNYRITDIQAALGTSQLARIDAFIERRHRLADRYDALLRNMPVRPLQREPDSHSSFHLYVVCLPDDGPGELRKRVFEGMRLRAIGVNVHYIPVHLQPLYRELGFSEGQFPEAERFYRQALTLPLYPDMTESDQDRVVSCLESALQDAEVFFGPAA